jgi:hypothetical protein
MSTPSIPTPSIPSVSTPAPPAEWIGERSDEIIARWAIADLSQKTYSFTPTLVYLLTTSIMGKTLPIASGFVLYYDLPTWPAGSTFTTSLWAAEIGKMLGSAYTVGIGGVYVSVAKTA